jgi:putative heme iron utilization protein
VPRPSTRNLSETTRETFAGIVSRQTATLAERERAYTALTKAQERRAETIATLDAEVDHVRRALAQADAELVDCFGLDQAAELTGTPAPVLAKIAKAARA